MGTRRPRAVGSPWPGRRSTRAVRRRKANRRRLRRFHPPGHSRVSPYMWFAGVSGDVGVNSDLPTVDVDVDFSEIFKAIDWFPPPVMLAGEVRYGRFAFLSDLMFLGLEADDSKTRGPVSVKGELDMDMVIWTFGAPSGPSSMVPRRWTCWPGGRLWNVDATAKFSGPFAGAATQRKRDLGRSDHQPLRPGRAGQRVRAPGRGRRRRLRARLRHRLAGAGHASVSGRRSVTLDAGYRYLAVDYKNGGFKFDMALSGPIIGASIRF